MCLAGEAVKRENISTEGDQKVDSLRTPVCVQTHRHRGIRTPWARAVGTKRDDSCPKDRSIKTRTGSEKSECVRDALTKVTGP